MFKFALKYPFQATSVVCLLLYVTAGFFFNTLPLSGDEISYLLITGLLSLCCSNLYYKIILFILSLILFLFFLLSGSYYIIFLWGMSFVLLVTFVTL